MGEIFLEMNFRNSFKILEQFPVSINNRSLLIKFPYTICKLIMLTAYYTLS